MDSRRDLFEDRQRFLLKRAEAIVSQIAEQVDPYENLILAGLFARVDETAKAETHFEHAIAAATGLDKGTAWRNFAGYLFAHGRFEQGRSFYRLAVGSVGGTEDYMRPRRIDLMERWAENEARSGNTAEAGSLLLQARTESLALVHPPTPEVANGSP